MAYVKIHLDALLLDSELPNDPYLMPDLERYFPDALDRYSEQMRAHRLRRELIATVVANQLVDRAGTTFAYRLNEETGVGVPQLARGFAIARDVFEMPAFWAEVEALDNRIEAGTQLSMLIDGRRLVERSTRWLVRSRPRGEIDVARPPRGSRAGPRARAAACPRCCGARTARSFDRRFEELSGAGVAPELAHRVAAMNSLLAVFDIVQDASACGAHSSWRRPSTSGSARASGLDWLRDRIFELPRSDRWQALARAALRDDLYELHRRLTRDVLNETEAAGRDDGDGAIEEWLAEQRRVGAARRAGAVGRARVREL